MQQSADAITTSALKQAQKQQTFLGLPLLVVRLVLDLLHRSDIYSFRLVSRACRYLSEPVIFRNLVLHDRTSSSAGIFTNFCHRICDPEDALREIVHHVQIGPLVDRFSYPGETILERAVENIKDLRDFSWHMRFAIPEKILELLRTKYGGARIHIVNRDRNPDKGYTPPDYQALSSPQLHSLDYTAYGATERIAHLEWEFYSELSAIKKCLLQARNLKIFNLQVNKNHTPRQDFWTAGPECLSFDEGDDFPPLQELSFKFERYELSEKYCQQWARAMDWTKLRRLDLDHGSPNHLFAALTGRVPQLKVLVFGFWPSGFSWGYPNAGIFKAFSDSIDGLEEIVATNCDANPFDEVKDALLSKHGHSLKILRISYGATAQGWVDADVEGLARMCPGIRDLALKIATVNDRSANWPEATMKALQNFKQLRNLEVTLRLDQHLHIGQDSTELLRISEGSGGPPHLYLKERVSEEHAVSLYKQLLGNGEHTSIESVNVRFKTTHRYNEWAFFVKAQSRDGKRFLVEKKFAKANSVWNEVTPAGTSFSSVSSRDNDARPSGSTYQRIPTSWDPFG